MQDTVIPVSVHEECNYNVVITAVHQHKRAYMTTVLKLTLLVELQALLFSCGPCYFVVWGGNWNTVMSCTGELASWSELSRTEQLYWPTLWIQKRVNFFLRNNNFCSDIHYETHLELKNWRNLSNWFGCVMAQRCNNCFAGDHTLPSSQWIWGNGNSSAEDTFTPSVSLGKKYSQI